MKWLTNLVLTVCFGCKELAVILIACVPLIELKGAIPIGTEHYGLPAAASFWLAFLGSSLVCLPLLLILRPLHKWAKNRPNSVIVRAENIFKSKARNISEKSSTFYKLAGVFFFTAVPLPLTGVYSASVIAVVVGLGFWQSAGAIVLGNLVAGGLILLLTALLGSYVNIFLYILFAFALVLFAVFMYKVLKKNHKEKNNATE